MTEGSEFLSSNEIASAHEFGYYSVIVYVPRNDATLEGAMTATIL